MLHCKLQLESIIVLVLVTVLLRDLAKAAGRSSQTVSELQRIWNGALCV